MVIVVFQLQSNPAEIMESLLETYPVPEDKRMLLYTHLRLAYSFSKRELRLKCVQARLHAISVLGECGYNIQSFTYDMQTHEDLHILLLT